MTNLVELAESGNAEAQYELSVRYFYGDGVPQDYATAIMWIQKAAAQGLVEAQFDIAGCYERGDIVEQNYYTPLNGIKKQLIMGILKQWHNWVCFIVWGKDAMRILAKP